MMTAEIISHEQAIRLLSFVSVLVLMMLLERLIPLRISKTSRVSRWVANLGIVFIDGLLVRLLMPILPYLLAQHLMEAGWGLFNVMKIPYALSLLLTIFIFDLVIYMQHVAFHLMPWLWKVHRVHHTDLDLDATTGVRFHPVEILISMVLKLLVVLVLGPTPESVILFEVLLNATSLFNHSNINMPKPLDAVIRLLIVTPNMHSVHHSVRPLETNSNFGFNFPWWDRMFGTYKYQQTKGPKDYTIGLSDFRNPRELTLYRLLILPFIK